MSFNRIKKLIVETTDTTPFDIPELGPKAVIHLAYAGSINKKYWNARFAPAIARSTKAAAGRKRKRGGDIVEDEVRRELATTEGRELDRELFPLHIIKGWDDVLNDKDKPATFTLKNVQAVVDMLCGHPSTAEMFDNMRNTASDISNFRELPEDLAETAKNSSSD